MKHTKSWIILACAAVLTLTGCSKGNDEKKETNGAANQTETNPPQNNNTSMASNDTMDNMMTYLNGQGITMNDMKPIDKMDFAAHEGRSFSYNGNTGYLYRLKSNDESMKALLDSAKNNGTVKVSVDGKEQEYSASVNGDYLFVYQKDANMSDLVTAIGSYMPGATTTTPNTGGEKTTPTSGTTDDETDKEAPKETETTTNNEEQPAKQPQTEAED